jgi:signal peptidase I
MVRRFAGFVGAALIFSLGAIALIGRLGRDWEARVAVRGHSMEPTLSHGDWLLVDPAAYMAHPPRPGDLVVAYDPRAPTRRLVKRVVAVDSGVVLGSDNPAHAWDRIGPLSPAAIIGRPWFRYWPSEVFGRVR